LIRFFFSIKKTINEQRGGKERKWSGPVVLRSLGWVGGFQKYWVAADVLSKISFVVINLIQPKHSWANVVFFLG